MACAIACETINKLFWPMYTHNSYKKIKALTEEWFGLQLFLTLIRTTLWFLAGFLTRTCEGITIQKMSHFCPYILCWVTNLCG